MTTAIIDNGFTTSSGTRRTPIHGRSDSDASNDSETIINDGYHPRRSKGEPGLGTTSSHSGCQTYIPWADM